MDRGLSVHETRLYYRTDKRTSKDTEWKAIPDGRHRFMTAGGDVRSNKNFAVVGARRWEKSVMWCRTNWARDEGPA